MCVFFLNAVPFLKRKLVFDDGTKCFCDEGGLFASFSLMRTLGNCQIFLV